MALLPVTLRLKSVDKSRLRITLEANQECEYKKVTRIFFLHEIAVILIIQIKQI